MPLGHARIALQLLRRVIEDHDSRARRREDGRLLSAARRQAQHMSSCDVEPLTRHRLDGREDDRPPPLSRLFDLLRRHRYRPLIAAVGQRVPGDAIVRSNIHHRNFSSRRSVSVRRFGEN